MIKYPTINGLYIDMPFEEVNSIILDNEYTMQPFDNHNIFEALDTRKQKDHADLIIAFFNDKLEYFYIYDWHRFFRLDDTMTYDNLIEIFLQYFLKGFNYRVITEEYGRFKLWGKSWDVVFNRKKEIIEYNWHKYFH